MDKPEDIRILMYGVFKTIIVQSEDAQQARDIASSFVPAADKMFETRLSQNGGAPATHYISSGYIPEEIVSALNSGVDGIDISDDQPFQALSRLDLQIVVPEE